MALSFLVALQSTFVESADTSSSAVLFPATMPCKELSSIAPLAVTIEAYVTAIAEVLVVADLRRVGHPWYMCPDWPQP
jgi:hypothetical protein